MIIKDTKCQYLLSGSWQQAVQFQSQAQVLRAKGRSYRSSADAEVERIHPPVPYERLGFAADVGAVEEAPGCCVVQPGTVTMQRVDQRMGDTAISCFI